MREKARIELDEQSSLIVQLFNILLEAVQTDTSRFRADIESVYNRLVSSLATYVDFSCLHPVKRAVLEQNIMGDVILSHLEAEAEEETGDRQWLRLSGRTKALIAVALAECGRSGIGLPGREKRQLLRMERV